MFSQVCSKSRGKCTRALRIRRRQPTDLSHSWRVEHSEIGQTTAAETRVMSSKQAKFSLIAPQILNVNKLLKDVEIGNRNINTNDA